MSIEFILLDPGRKRRVKFQGELYLLRRQKIQFRRYFTLYTLLDHIKYLLPFYATILSKHHQTRIEYQYSTPTTRNDRADPGKLF